LGLHGGAPAENEQLAGQIGGTLDLGFDVIDCLAAFLAQAGAFVEESQLESHGGQNIIEIMRETARELADGIQFLDLAQFSLELALLRDVLSGKEEKRLTTDRHGHDGNLQVTILSRIAPDVDVQVLNGAPGAKLDQGGVQPGQILGQL
jgi:hypothetical protein